MCSSMWLADWKTEMAMSNKGSLSATSIATATATAGATIVTTATAILLVTLVSLSSSPLDKAKSRIWNYLRFTAKDSEFVIKE